MRLPHVRRPPEWGVDPVPPAARVLRTFDLFVLWSSLGVGLLVFAAGTLLVAAFGLTIWESLAVSLVGSVVGSLMLAGAAHHGSRAGVPTMVSLRPVLGRFGSYAPTVVNVVQLLGWAAFELLVMGIAAAKITGDVFGPWTSAIFVPVFGAVVAGLALGGPLVVVRKWLERFAIWLVYVSTALIAIGLAVRGVDMTARPVVPPLPGIAPYLLALDLVIVMPISWWPLVSDYNRFARTPRDSALGTVAGYAIANTVFYVLGAALFLYGAANGQDFIGAMALLGLGFLPVFFILIDETDNAFANVYSTAVSAQNLFPKRRQLWFIVGAAAIAVAGAWALVARGEGIGGGYEVFLITIGGLFVPLLGVVIADSLVLRRSTYRREEFLDRGPRVRVPALVSWFLGTALYFALFLNLIPGFPPTGATLPSFSVAGGLHIAFAKVESALARVRRHSTGGGGT